MASVATVNSLRYRPERCSNCGLCSAVCPHGVFVPDWGAATLAHPERCMECGACMRNCPSDAITVDPGVGCAYAMFKAALTGKEDACCGPDESCCS